MTKSDRQGESITLAIDNNYNGILHLCIRFGKTLIGLSLADKFYNTDNGNVVVLVPSSNIKNSWLNEQIKWDTGTNATIVTANQILSINNYLLVDLLIVDEVHKFTSEVLYTLINGSKIRYKHIIMLTGTLPGIKLLPKLTKLAPIIDTITEKEAIENGWVSDYVEYNIPLELPDKSKKRYVDLTNILKTVFAKYRDIYKEIIYNNDKIFRDDLDLILSCINGKYVNKYWIKAADIRDAVSYKMNGVLSHKLHPWHPDTIKKECVQMNNAIIGRNNILTSDAIKLEAVLAIYKYVQLPTICFSENIYFAERINAYMNSLYGSISFAYHSKTESGPLIDPSTNRYYEYSTGNRAGEPKIFSKDKQLQYNIEMIKHNEIKFLSVVKALDEGITIPEIEVIITTAGSTNPIQYDQRTGRGKTFVSSDKIAKIYNLYFDDFYYDNVFYKSRDKEKLSIRQRNKSVIKVLNLADLM